ncbi:Aldo/keto reductase family protein [Gordonia westfalica]|uniref:Aldo/keto reductase family protein n=1 Tax=Gordonia westfalica TaxID=158898 RepID=A0A1H2GQ71_9ACTN|nr:Aldo/keto reductase family protein [Gordonia westfalica]
MQYRTLGRTGIQVSPYALGTLLLGASMGSPDHDESVRLIHTALDAGINFIDTADAYSLPPHGASEVVVGKALRGRRENVVLATKFSRPMGGDPNRRGTSRRWIVRAVEESLRRLQADYIDLYQSTTPTPTPISKRLSPHSPT